MSGRGSGGREAPIEGQRTGGGGGGENPRQAGASRRGGRAHGRGGLGFVQNQLRLADVAQAQLGVLAQAAFDQPAEVGRRILGKRAPIGLPADHVGENVGDVVGAGERVGAGQHLVEHHAEGPDIGALIDGPAARLLRSHRAH